MLQHMAILSAALLAPPLCAQTLITEFPWSVDFNNGNPFELTNGTEANQWMVEVNMGNAEPSLAIESAFTSGNTYWAEGDAWSTHPAESCSHAWIDLELPVYYYDIALSFDVRVGGVPDDDFLRVIVVPTTYTPVAGHWISSWVGGDGYQIGADLVGMPTWETVHYTIPPGFAGRTIRLVFQWRNDDSWGVQPAAAIDNISVTLGQCVAPFNIAVSEVTSSSAHTAWQTNPFVSGYDYELRTSGEPGSGTAGLYDASTFLTEELAFNDLSPGTPYNLYLRAHCPDSLTGWSTPAFFVTDPACGSLFYDTGGPNGRYGRLEDRTYVVCPSEVATAASAQFTFLSLALGDVLKVYDGSIASGSPKAVLMGSGPLQTLVSENPDGCLTFRSISNGTVEGLGWVANITCAPRTGCAVWGVSTEPVDQSSMDVSWHCTGAIPPYVVEYTVAEGQPGEGSSSGPQGEVQLSDTATTTLLDLVPGGVYDVHVRASCTAAHQYEGASMPRRMQVPPACGYSFTDIGGDQTPYLPYEERANTICPTGAGQSVSLTFSDFQVEPWYDALYVFDGPDVLSPLMSSSNPTPLSTPEAGPGGWWGLVPENADFPGPFLSTHVSGCLTLRFISDNAVEFDGWIADVSCTVVGLPTIVDEGSPVTCFPNPAASGSEITISGLSSGRFPYSGSIISQLGQEIVELQVVPDVNGMGTTALPALPSGIYHLRLRERTGRIATARFVVL